MLVIRAEYFSTVLLTLTSLCRVRFTMLNSCTREFRLLEIRRPAPSHSVANVHILTPNPRLSPRLLHQVLTLGEQKTMFLDRLLGHRTTGLFFPNWQGALQNLSGGTLSSCGGGCCQAGSMVGASCGARASSETGTAYRAIEPDPVCWLPSVWKLFPSF